MDNPWIIHGLSIENEVESGSKVVFESDVVYWVLTLSCKTKVIESGGVCGSENGRKWHPENHRTTYTRMGDQVKQNQNLLERKLVMQGYVLKKWSSTQPANANAQTKVASTAKRKLVMLCSLQRGWYGGVYFVFLRQEGFRQPPRKHFVIHGKSMENRSMENRMEKPCENHWKLDGKSMENPWEIHG